MDVRITDFQMQNIGYLCSALELLPSGQVVLMHEVILTNIVITTLYTEDVLSVVLLLFEISVVKHLIASGLLLIW